MYKSFLFWISYCCINHDNSLPNNCMSQNKKICKHNKQGWWKTNQSLIIPITNKYKDQGAETVQKKQKLYFKDIGKKSNVWIRNNHVIVMNVYLISTYIFVNLITIQMTLDFLLQFSRNFLWWNFNWGLQGVFFWQLACC